MNVRVHLALLVSALIVLAWSGWAPSGRLNWVMETLPAMVGGVVLVAMYRRFTFTTVTYALIWFFALILMVGGHYTYADVPIGNWARDAFGLSRNHFDRFGHFFQGVIPAVVAREVWVRTGTVRRGGWLAVICIAMALAISACYELFEWRYAVMFGGQRAEDFLGSQGDVWDAQKDMFQALLGATAAMLLASGVQDRQMRAMGVGLTGAK